MRGHTSTEPEAGCPTVGLAGGAVILVYLCVAFARQGFNISDEGLVLDWGYRMLHGAVPHRDFVTPLPVGSALLHLVDFLSPFPLLISSRVIALFELVTYSTLLLSLVTRTPFRRWRVRHVAALLMVSVFDLHVFPLTAWYTIDGLLLVATGLVVLLGRRPSPPGPWRAAIGMACCGAAALTKQSFLPATLMGLITIAVLAGQGRRRTIWGTYWAGAAGAALPLAAYVGWMALSGGLPEMMRQELGTRITLGAELFSDFQGPLLLQLVATLVIAAVVFRELRAEERRIEQTGPGRPRARIYLLVAGAVILGAAWILTGRLSEAAPWGSALQWMLITSVGIDLARGRTVTASLVALWVLALSFMVRLSYGWPNPDLLGGLLVAVLLARLWHSPAVQAHIERRPAMALTTAALILALGTAAFGYSSRGDRVYRDVAAKDLTYDLGQVSPAYAGLLTGRDTFMYEMQLRRCVEEHPASRVSVMPDNPSASIAFGFEPLVPISLLQPDTYSRETARLITFASTAGQAGSYLVLVQTWSGPPQPLVTAGPDSPVLAYGDRGFAAKFYGAFAGERIACASFRGIYRP